MSDQCEVPVRLQSEFNYLSFVAFTQLLVVEAPSRLCHAKFPVVAQAALKQFLGYRFVSITSAERCVRQAHKFKSHDGFVFFRVQIWEESQLNRLGIVRATHPTPSRVGAFVGWDIRMDRTYADYGLESFEGMIGAHTDLYVQSEVICFDARSGCGALSADVNTTFTIKESGGPGQFCTFHVGSLLII